MKIIKKRNNSKTKQFFISISSVLITSIVCFLGTQYIGYRTIALILLVNVSILAMLFDILPVLISALLSALVWNFFFIPPILTFHIDNTEDLLMFLLYFLIASVNAVLTFKIRKEEEKVRDREEKEKTIKLYNTLLNSLSHELRTPISTIIGSIDAINENKNNLSETNKNELLSQISIASLRLNTHVENLLNMSRLESGILKLNFDWCDINELIYSVIQNISIPHSQIIVFNPSEQLPLFKFDRGLIEQVIFNLISNAIAYTSEKSTISIEVYEKNGECQFIVSDTGNGIPITDIELLFDKFYRGHQMKSGGLGIGLSIVKGFIEAHNGLVNVEHNHYGGLSFMVRFPAELSYLNNLKNE